MSRTSSDRRTRVGKWLLLLSWAVGAGPLNLGMEREEGHVLAAVLFLLARVLWFVARDLVMGGGKPLRTLAFVVPTVWLVNLIVVGVAGALCGYWSWFLVAALFMVGAVVAASHYREARRRTGALQGEGTIPRETPNPGGRGLTT